MLLESYLWLLGLFRLFLVRQTQITDFRHDSAQKHSGMCTTQKFYIFTNHDTEIHRDYKNLQ
jgi:hypothetical protein